MKLVDVPLDASDWEMSSHPRPILEMHNSLVRQMKNLATFRFDTFSDALVDFRSAISDFVGEGMEKCRDGKLGDLSRWPLENLRILDQIDTNIRAKGGPSNLKLSDWLEMYVSMNMFDFVLF